MSSFTERPILTPLNCGKRWVVRKEFSYEIGHLGSGDKVVIPVGFVTDLASTPKPLWSILPPFGRYLPSAILHDYLYATKEKSRKESDKIFLEGMMIFGDPVWKRYAMYYTVRLCGKSSYGKPKASLVVSEEMEEINKINMQIY